MDLFDAYRKMFATRGPETVVWWYCGIVTAQKEGLGVIPQTQAETIMAYRTRDVDADTFTIDWTEVGVFRDLAIGEPMAGWFNPFLGTLLPYPRTFVDGPATYTVRRDGPQGLSVALRQHNARIDAVSVQAHWNEQTLGLVQTEDKTRTFHRPDGSLPSLDSPEATQIRTELSIWSDRRQVLDPATGNIAARGHYRSGGRGQGGSWSQTQVAGVLVKARPDEPLNPIAWQRLMAQFPDFFRNGRVDPAFE